MIELSEARISPEVLLNELHGTDVFVYIDTVVLPCQIVDIYGVFSF